MTRISALGLGLFALLTALPAAARPADCGDEKKEKNPSALSTNSCGEEKKKDPAALPQSGSQCGDEKKKDPAAS
ncbi:MAG TPA: hypothetical protein VFQ61_21300 [Polyangiaceae bacterium]|nr:hypothetical protein [Polyangiaceae bacterium]